MTDPATVTILTVEHPLGWKFNAEGPADAVQSLWDTWLEHIRNRVIGAATDEAAVPSVREWGKRSTVDWTVGRSLWDDGRTPAEIAKVLKCSTSTVYHHAKEYRWPVHNGDGKSVPRLEATGS